MGACSVYILAVNNLGLAVIQLKAAGLKAFIQDRENVFSLCLGPAVQKTIVGVSAKWYLRYCSLRPRIKSVVKKQICEYWAYDTSLRGAL